MSTVIEVKDPKLGASKTQLTSCYLPPSFFPSQHHACTMALAFYMAFLLCSVFSIQQLGGAMGNFNPVVSLSLISSQGILPTLT